MILVTMKTGGKGGAGGGDAGAAAAELEWKYVQGLISEAALIAGERQLGVPPDKAQARLKALRPLRAG